MKEQYGLHWFRRDLRITGNPALDENLKRNDGRVLGVFIFDRKFLARPDFSHSRFLFFLKTLESLRSEMRERGGDLLFLDGGPIESWHQLINDLKDSKLGAPAWISWNRDYEPWARNRDSGVRKLLEDDHNLAMITERDHLLIEPDELFKDVPGSFYQVYTPFKKKWFSIFEGSEINSRLLAVGKGLKSGPANFSLKWPREFSKSDVLESILAETSSRVSIPMPEVGHAAAKKLLKAFKENGVDQYSTKRDIPSISGTSKMSIYLKNGSITVPQIIALLKLTPKSKASELKYFEELVWREFYYHILWHRPSVEHESFNPKYKNLKWENDKKFFQAWKEGRTGYPIVDAGMRQLNATGWMHNRVRMIVASFLTKDLLIDWRWGERYFMEKLLDGDLGPNNGGWQWAASTGCDPQPYFRIFNPTSQGEKFDPEGKYVREWVPELRDRPLKVIHEPLNPIVDHATQRDKALKLYKEPQN